MVPLAILEGYGKDVHDGVIQRLARSRGIHLLWIVGTGTDDIVRMVRGVQNNGLDVRSLQALFRQSFL